MKGEKMKRNPERTPPLFEETQLAAYYHWLNRGSPEGDPLADWQAVEKRREEENEELWDGVERRWEEENPGDDEPGESS